MAVKKELMEIIIDKNFDYVLKEHDILIKKIQFFYFLLFTEFLFWLED